MLYLVVILLNVLYLVVLLLIVLYLVVILLMCCIWLLYCLMCCIWLFCCLMFYVYLLYLNFVIERGMNVDVQMSLLDCVFVFTHPPHLTCEVCRFTKHISLKKPNCLVSWVFASISCNIRSSSLTVLIL